MSPKAWKLLGYGLAAFATVLLILPLVLAMVPQPFVASNPQEVEAELQAQGERVDRVEAAQEHLTGAQILGGFLFAAISFGLAGPLVAQIIERRLKEGR